jgi:hypothetical protein
MRLNAALLAFLAIVPASAFSQTLDSDLSCAETAHDFVADLVGTQSIEVTPMRIEPNSVNAFRPRSGAPMTAFGLRVHAVFGYQPGDPLFKAGGSATPSGPVYGAVVLGSAEAVKRRLADAGSSAVVHPVIPLVLTAIVCEQQPATEHTNR